ncbi:hypothetical protein [Streptomyces sp. NPDC045714]|uniref:hypothetical protein n=1 Tax=Streptomyces sp. NPDC045714 TaxID=3154913 RepID=UPI003401D6F5
MGELPRSVRAEQGRLREAHRLAEHALSRNPRSGVAVHALAHAQHELGAGPASTRMLDAWLAEDAGAVRLGHPHWHAAPQSIACGDFADARHRADRALRREDVGMRAATNWRLMLVGQDPAGRGRPDHVRELLAAPGSMAEVFHTFHLALALAVEAATEDLEILAGRASADPRTDYREVLAPVLRALAHLTAGRPRAAADVLAALGGKAERIGGVRVEREIIQDTLARALIDSGDPARAAALLHHRTTAPPHHRTTAPPHHRTTTRHHHSYEDLLLAPR